MSWNPATFALARWQFTLIATLLVAALGAMAFLTVPRTEDPQLNFPNFVVVAVLPGAAPEEVEQLVTKPIEEAIYKLDNLREVRSRSSDGLSVTRVEFLWGSDPDRSYDDLVREANALRQALPDGLARLEVERVRPIEVSISQVALVSRTLPMRRLEKVADRLRERLASIPGVQEARYWGTGRSEMRVALDPARLAALNVAADDVARALRAGGEETPIGVVEAGARRLNVRQGGAYADAAAVAAVPLRTDGGRVLRVGDVADVGWAMAEADHLTRFNGERAVLVSVTQGQGQDVMALSSAIMTELDAFERTLPAGVRLVRGFDQAVGVERRLRALQRDFLLAIGLVLLTLLPLGVRASIVVMIAIPLSLAIGLLVLASLGFTLNQIAIAGFVVALGILVDDAIVVTENIARQLRAGKSPAAAAAEGTGQIVRAVLGCTACLVLAFVPLLALPEASGQFIQALPVAVIATVLGSLVVALTVIPLAASLLLRPSDDPEGNRLLRAVNAGIHRLYAPVLHRALDRPVPTVVGLLLLTTLSVPLMLAIGTSLFPPAQMPQFLVRVEAQPSSTLAQTDRAVRFAEAAVRRLPDVAWYSANVGRGHPQLYYNVAQRETDPAFGEIAVSLDKWEPGRSDALLERLRRDLATFPGATFSTVVFVNGPEIEAPVVIRLSGPSLAVLSDLAARAEAALRATPALRDVNNPLRRPRIDLKLEVDDAAAAASGVTSGAVRAATQLALTGTRVAQLRDEDDDVYDVRVGLPTSGRNPVSLLGSIYVPAKDGASVALAELARPALVAGLSQIDRIDRARTVSLTASVRPDVLISRATRDARARVAAAVDLPPGYRISLGGEAATQANSFAGFGPAIIVATLGILAVLVLEFGSLRVVAVVFGIVPFGLFGGVAALWLTGNSLSFTAAIGLIALLGIEIKNSILLVDVTEQLRAAGTPMREAVEKAGEQRFLPVLLTSVTAIAGLLPLALEGSGLYSPLAIALIGGLVTSTLLARIATPAMYLLLARR